MPDYLNRFALESILKAIPTGIVVVEKSGNVIYGNDRAIQLFGEDRPQNARSNLFSSSLKFLTTTGEILAAKGPNEKIEPQNGNSSSSEMTTKQTESFSMATSTMEVPIRNAKGEIIATAVILEDVAERNKREMELRRSRDIAEKRAEELEKLQQRLEEKTAEVEEYATKMEELAQERTKQLEEVKRLAAIGATAGMVGHDIRNPLQAITSDVYLLKQELTLAANAEKVNLQESLESIEKNVFYIDKIVSDLQDFARPLIPVIEETDLQSVCEESLVVLNLPKSIRTTVKIGSNAKTIFTDQVLLKRLLRNLLLNAVQAMPDGGAIVIRARRNSANIIITIQDTGVGIPDEQKKSIFVPLFTTKSKGQGFGLAVAKRLAESLKGEISFQSEVGKGTTFKVQLLAYKD